jgi:hypothetical protein
MKSAFFTTLAALLLVALPAGARTPHPVLEDGREFSASMLNLPATGDGSVTVVACSACKRMDLSATTHFFIGEQEVSYAELKRHLDSHPTAFVLVVTPANKTNVSRISASATNSQ